MVGRGRGGRGSVETGKMLLVELAVRDALASLVVSAPSGAETGHD